MRGVRVPLFPLMAAAVITAGCAAAPVPSRTALEVRAAQTRTFDTPDAKVVMKALLNVLQDEGYVVRNAVVDLGLITAEKETDLAPGRSGPETSSVAIVGPQIPTTYRKIEVSSFTGNVSQSGVETKVRVSVRRKVLDNRGDTVVVQPIEDPVFYQDFFSRMDKSLYLQKEQL